MRHILTALLVTIFCFSAKAQFKALIVNEFSQGDAGNREYIELLVVGNKTCTDSTADIRGWIVDDQNGWYGSTGTGITTGHFRFAYNFNWAKIRYGSIILLYNNEPGNKNLSINLPDDETDANNDGVYILPINSLYIEEHNSLPASPSSVGFSYPATGYTGSINNWTNRMSLRNSADAVIVTDPSNPYTAHFSIVYGFTPAPGFQVPVILKPTVSGSGADINFYLSDDQYTNAPSFIIGNVLGNPSGFPSNETPAMPNGGANSAWIAAMRKPAVIISPTNKTACIAQGQSYNFDGDILNTTGYYSHRFTTASGCDSIVNLYLLVSRIQAQSFNGCESYTYNDVTYTSSTILNDTIKSLLTNCDSLINIVSIQINPVKNTYLNICLNNGQVYNFNGQILITSGDYVSTLTGATGCDSLVHLHLVISSTQIQTISNCGPYFYKGILYTSSAIIKDTLRSIASGCDSIYFITSLQINPVSLSVATICLKQGESYNFNGNILTANGIYTDTLLSFFGCDSIVQLFLTVTKNDTLSFSGCSFVNYKGTTYTSSTSLHEIISSAVTGCDSVLRTINIIVNTKPDLIIAPYRNICKGDSITIFASVENASIEWLGAAPGNSITVAPFTNTTYTAIATTIAGCSDTASVVVSVENFMLQVSANPNPVITGTSVNLQTSANMPYQILSWQPAMLFANQKSTTQIFTLDSSITITVTARSLSGCTDTATLKIIADPLAQTIFIPTAFTPNGDGKNDVFRILGGEIKQLDFKIFDRWGQLIFATTNRATGWDGRLKNKLQLTGVYIYTMKAILKNGTVITKNGTVSLIR